MTYATLRTTATPDNASRTITITENSSENVPSNNGDGSSSGRLRLRGASRNGQKVTWDDDVVDNEGCGRKSSKICCIYHKPRKFDESSSEESSDSDSDSSGGPIRRRRKCNHDHSGEGDADPAAPEPSHKFEPNAYERTPKSNKGKGKQKANS